MNKESFVFYKSYWDSLKSLPQDVQCRVIDIMCNYVFEEKESNGEGIEQSIWLLIKPTLDKSIKRYENSVENGKKGGRPKESNNNPTITQQKPKRNPTITQHKANQNLNVNVNDNVNDNDNDNTNENKKYNDLSVTDNRLNSLISIFNSPSFAVSKIRKEWNNLDESEKGYALSKVTEYIKFESSRGNEDLNLMYYIKDKKWEWDLTIKRKNNKVIKQDYWKV
jgi:hypothetical protein